MCGFAQLQGPERDLRVPQGRIPRADSKGGSSPSLCGRLEPPYSLGTPGSQAFRSPTLGPVSLRDRRSQTPLIALSVCTYPTVLFLCRDPHKTHLRTAQLAAAGPALCVRRSRCRGLGTWCGARNLLNGSVPPPSRRRPGRSPSPGKETHR